MTLADLQELGFPTRVGKLQLAGLLKQKYPEHAWEKLYVKRPRFAYQNRLERVVRDLFPVHTQLLSQALHYSLFTIFSGGRDED